MHIAADHAPLWPTWLAQVLGRNPGQATRHADAVMTGRNLPVAVDRCAIHDSAAGARLDIDAECPVQAG